MRLRSYSLPPQHHRITPGTARTPTAEPHRTEECRPHPARGHTTGNRRGHGPHRLQPLQQGWRRPNPKLDGADVGCLTVHHARHEDVTKPFPSTAVADDSVRQLHGLFDLPPRRATP